VRHRRRGHKLAERVGLVDIARKQQDLTGHLGAAVPHLKTTTGTEREDRFGAVAVPVVEGALRNTLHLHGDPAGGVSWMVRVITAVVITGMTQVELDAS
jgi:hypothetical protein